MGSLERRIRQLEELNRASGSTGEDMAERKAALLETMRSAREKAEREEAEGKPQRCIALDNLEEFMRRRARGA
jgi:hypothetical protein